MVAAALMPSAAGPGATPNENTGTASDHLRRVEHHNHGGQLKADEKMVTTGRNLCFMLSTVFPKVCPPPCVRCAPRSKTMLVARRRPGGLAAVSARSHGPVPGPLPDGPTAPHAGTSGGSPPAVT